MLWLNNSLSREQNIYWHFLKTCYKPTGEDLTSSQCVLLNLTGSQLQADWLESRSPLWSLSVQETALVFFHLGNTRVPVALPSCTLLSERSLNPGRWIKEKVGEKQLCCFRDLEGGLKGMAPEAITRILWWMVIRGIFHVLQGTNPSITPQRVLGCVFHSLSPWFYFHYLLLVHSINFGSSR